LTINRTILVLVDYAKYNKTKELLHRCLAIVQRFFEKAQAQEEFVSSINAKIKQTES